MGCWGALSLGLGAGQSTLLGTGTHWPGLRPQAPQTRRFLSLSLSSLVLRVR